MNKHIRFTRWAALTAALIMALSVLPIASVTANAEQAATDVPQTAAPLLPAAVLSWKPVKEKELTLVFEGRPDQMMLDRLLPLLKERGIQAGFFIPGILAAEHPEMITRIVNDGHWLGNYMLYGERRAQELDSAEQRLSIQRAQTVLGDIGGSTPVYMKGNVTTYTPALLTAIGQAGIPYALQPSRYINHTSFKAENQVDRYVQETPRGTILMVKINQPLEAEEMPDTYAKPASSADPLATPGPKDPMDTSPTRPVDERLAQVLRWLLPAYQRYGFQFVTPDVLLTHQSGELSQLLDQMANETNSRTIADGLTAQSPQAEVVTGSLVPQNVVSLILEGEVEGATLDAMGALLNRKGMQAAFFIPAQSAMLLQDNLKALQAQGHVIGNYLLGGETHAERLDVHNQVETILHAQMILSHMVTAPTYLRANLSEYDTGLLQAIRAAGLPYAVQPTVYLNHTSFSTPEQAHGFAASLKPGAILSIKMNQALTAAEVKPGAASKATPTASPDVSASPTPQLSPATPAPSHAPRDPQLVESKLLQILDWLTDGLLAHNTRVLSLEELAVVQHTEPALAIAAIQNDTYPDQLAGGLAAQAPVRVLRSGASISGGKRLSLVFEGSASDGTLLAIADLLDAHGIKAVFFLPAGTAFGQSGTVRLLLDRGHRVGNYMMDGEKDAANLTLKAQVTSLYQAQQSYIRLFNVTPTLFKANDSVYTETLLRAAGAAGLTAAVEPIAYLNHTSFREQAQVVNYMARVLPGSIISIKMNQTISARELGPTAVPAAPTATPEATPQATPQPTTALTPAPLEERLLLVVRWVLDEATKNGFTFSTPEEIDRDQFTPYQSTIGLGVRVLPRPLSAPESTQGTQGLDFPWLQDVRTQLEQAPVARALTEDSPTADIIGGSLLQEREVSLVFEAMEDVASINAIREVLDARGVKGVFLVPASVWLYNPEIVKGLTDAGHQVGNYLMQGERNAHTMTAPMLGTSMQAAQLVIQNLTGSAPELFKGSVTENTTQVRQLAKLAGVSYALSPSHVLSSTSFKTQEQAQRYAQRTPQGALVLFKVDRGIDASELPAVTTTATPTIQPVETATPEPVVSQTPLILSTPEPEAVPSGAPTPGAQRAPIVQQVAWLVDAYLAEGFAIVTPQKLRADQSGPFASYINQILTETESAQVAEAIGPQTPRAKVLGAQPVLENEIALIIEGQASSATFREILTVLEQHQVTATFYIPGMLAAGMDNTLRDIVAAGHSLGNYGMADEKRLEEMPRQLVVLNLSRGHMVIMDLTLHTPLTMRGNLTEYTDDVLAAAGAVGLQYAVKPNQFFNHTSFRNRAQVETFADRTASGGILSLKLNQTIDASELPTPTPVPQITPGPTEEPDLFVTPVPPPESFPEGLTNEQRAVLALDWLLTAYENRNMAVVTPQQLLADRNEDLAKILETELIPTGKTTERITQVPTTDREVGLLVQFPQTREAATQLIKGLRTSDARVFLAVTASDMFAYKDELIALAKAGHTIVSRGYTGRSVSAMDYRDAYIEIKSGLLAMQRALGLYVPLYVPLTGTANDQVLMAAKDAGVYLLGYALRLTADEKRTAQAEADERLQWGIQRGDLLLARFPGASPENIKLINLINDEVVDTGYTLVGTELFDNTYKKAALKDIPGWDAVKINLGFNPNQSLLWRQFTRFPAGEKTVYIAIDDWGSDKTITKLLDVLAEHDVPATFFVVNKRAALNPNLLRAIDEAGHSIGSHSYEHDIITGQETRDLQMDIVMGYQAVTEALGKPPDLVFQPPQLEMDRKAVNAILATGYYAVISSDVSTHDYIKPAEEVVAYVLPRLRKGSVILIHSSDHASGADALPGIIEYAKAQGYTFGRFIDYLPATVENGKVTFK